MVAVDARGRPVLASVAYSVTIFVTVSATLACMPAFAESLPSVSETALAAVVTVLAGLAGGVLHRGGSRDGTQEREDPGRLQPDLRVARAL
jgi:hypothetical protein